MELQPDQPETARAASTAGATGDPLKGKSYIWVQQRCGICRALIRPRRDPVYVLLDSSDGRTFSGLLSPLVRGTVENRRPLTGLGVRTYLAPDYRMPWVPDDVTATGVVVHQLCLTLYLLDEEGVADKVADKAADKVAAKVADKADRQWLLGDLWSTLAHRTPWRHCIDLPLYTGRPWSHDTPVMDIVASVGGALGLPGLAKLPLEILDMIWFESGLVWFWAAVAARTLRLQADTRRTAQASRSMVVPWRAVASWDRATDTLVTVTPDEATHLPPLLAVSVDHDGIYAIARVERAPSTCLPRRQMTVHIVTGEPLSQDEKDDPDRCSEIAFSNGRARLLPRQRRAFVPWTVPNPPDERTFNFASGACRFQLDSSGSPGFEACAYMVACDLNRCRGLSFSYIQGRIYSIRFHTTLDYAPKWTPRKTCHACTHPTTVFLPIGPKDRITAIWTYAQTSVNIAFRFALAGDVVIGTASDPRAHDIEPACLAHGNDLTLAYGLPTMRGAIWLLGARDARYTDETAKIEAHQPANLPRPLAPILPRFDTAPRRTQYMHAFSQAGDTFFSAAPTANLLRLRVYANRHPDYVSGLLLEYLDGSMRALGLFDIQHDPHVTYERPAYLHYQADESTRDRYPLIRPTVRRLRVFASSSAPASSSESESSSESASAWTCQPLGSTTMHFCAIPNGPVTLKFFD